MKIMSECNKKPLDFLNIGFGFVSHVTRKLTHFIAHAKRLNVLLGVLAIFAEKIRNQLLDLFDEACFLLKIF